MRESRRIEKNPLDTPRNSPRVGCIPSSFHTTITHPDTEEAVPVTVEYERWDCGVSMRMNEDVRTVITEVIYPAGAYWFYELPAATRERLQREAQAHYTAECARTRETFSTRTSTTD